VSLARWRLLPVLLAVLLPAAGCGPGRKDSAKAAPEREWLKNRSAGRAGENASSPGWAREDADLPTMKVGSLPGSRVPPPKNEAEIIKYLGSRKIDERIVGLIAALEKHPPRALARLVSIARRDPVFAAPATQAIAAYKNPAGERALVAVLKSGRGDARITAAAALALRDIRPGGPTERALIGAVFRDRGWKVRAGSARAIRLGTRGRFGANTELKLLKAMDGGKQPYPVRLECAAALAQAGIPSGWLYLQAVSLNRQKSRAMLALTLAAEVGGNRGAAILGLALESRDTRLWTTAVELFPLVGRRAAMMALAAKASGRGELARRAALALAPFEGRRILPELVAALEHGSSVMRAASCAAMTRAVGAEASAALERKLLDSREVTKVRVAAARGLGQVGGPVVAPNLRRLAKSESDAVVRAAVKDALRLVEARLKKGAGAVSEPAAERFAFSRWELVELLSGSRIGCRLRDERGGRKSYYIGDEVALGYRLARTLGAGDAPDSVEVIMAGRAATRTDLLRVILTKGDRSVVLVKQAIEAEK
jgi:HEAT repeats